MPSIDLSKDEVAPPRDNRVIEILDEEFEGGATERKGEPKREAEKLTRENDKVSKQDDWKRKGTAAEPAMLSGEQQKVIELMESGRVKNHESNLFFFFFFLFFFL